MKRHFIPYNKSELFKKINLISIEKVAETVVTKYGNSVLSVTPVSQRYEIFDIKTYLQNKIELIEQNFTISKYYFRLTKGVQELTLLSDPIEICGIQFHKSFFILNSSDKSRSLSFNAGLYCESKNFYVVSSIRNVGLFRKHIKGVTEAAELATEGLTGETFDEQITALKGLVGHKVSLSKLKEIIVQNPDNKSEHQKFDAFKNSLYYLGPQNQVRFTQVQYATLRTPSEKIVFDNKNDFYIDAFWAFQTYISLFVRQDSHIVKRESEKILTITQAAVRNQLLQELGI